MAEKLKNKVTDEELKIRATSDEKITVKLTNNYAFQKIFKNAKIVKGLPNVYRWFSKRSSLRRTPTLYPCRYLKFQPDDKPKLLP